MLKKIVFILFIVLLAACTGSKSSTGKKKQPNKKAKTEKTSSKKSSSKSSSSKSTAKPTEKQTLKADKTDNKDLYKAINLWIGTPHKLGGCDKDGIDCSCFVIQVYKEVYGIDLNRRSSDMVKDVSFVDRTDLKEGDLMFFTTGGSKTINHVGIYLKNNEFAHTSVSKGVSIGSLTETYWDKAYYSAGRHKMVK